MGVQLPGGGIRAGLEQKARQFGFAGCAVHKGAPDLFSANL
jgi:hypothetical protein